MVSFEIFVKAMPPSLSELKVLPSFCFAFKIPDDRAVTTIYIYISNIAIGCNVALLGDFETYFGIRTTKKITGFRKMFSLNLKNYAVGATPCSIISFFTAHTT